MTPITEREKLLERLPGSHLGGVRFDESKACLKGTRQQLLHEIQAWVHSPDEKRILWLSGGAGSGKSSVANSIAVFFDRLERLGACFRFNRDTEGLNNPNYLFGNLCYQLAHFSERLSGKALSVIKTMGRVDGSSLQTQAKKLLVDTTNAAELVGPIVVVIDALDESGNQRMRKDILFAIAAEFPKLPRSIKVLITSRDEFDIRGSLEGCSQEMRIDDTEGTAEDIASYIQFRMEDIRRRSHLPSGWPKTAKLQELNRSAERLFIWASVACNFIEDGLDPAVRLNQMLVVTTVATGERKSALTPLDNLYYNILENAFPDKDDLDAFRYVVGSIVAVSTPFTHIGLDSLLGLVSEAEDPLILANGHLLHLSSSNVIISSLRSILRVDPSDSIGREGPVRLLHPSLFDFLTSRADERFRIDLLEQNRILAFRCLAILNSQLKFDICDIRNLSLLNKEIEDLPKRIDCCIPEALRYSCQYFAYHVAKVSDFDTTLTDTLDKFVSKHLLHWIETMSLLGEISKAEDCLQVLSSSLKVRMKLYFSANH
jgi:hypothetical protein